MVQSYRPSCGDCIICNPINQGLSNCSSILLTWCKTKNQQKPVLDLIISRHEVTGKRKGQHSGHIIFDYLFSFAKPGSSAVQVNYYFKNSHIMWCLKSWWKQIRSFIRISNFAFMLFKINMNKIVATSQAIIYKTKGIFTSYSRNLSILHNILLKCLISLSFQIIY